MQTNKRRWFQISMREIALVVLAVGLALGWYREHSGSKLMRDAVAGLKSAKSSVRKSRKSGDLEGFHVVVTAKRIRAASRPPVSVAKSGPKPVSTNPQ